MGASVYVYGVLSAGDAEHVSSVGVEGSQVRYVKHAGIAALTSPVAADALAAAREVKAHWRVLEEAAARTTVLPVRFGTVMESEQAVRERLLEPNVERLERLLEELAGRVQLNVKADYDQELLLRDVVRRSPAVAGLRERLRSLPEAAGYYDRIRLGEMVAAEVAASREQDTRLALDSLEPHAVAASQEQLSSADTAFNLAFLVEREHIDAFGAAVRRLADQLENRARLRFVGPLPPYSFADADLTEESAAWA